MTRIRLNHLPAHSSQNCDELVPLRMQNDYDDALHCGAVDYARYAPYERTWDENVSKTLGIHKAIIFRFCVL